MMFITHVAVGLLAGLLYLARLRPEQPILIIFLVLLGTVLPDVDAPNAKAKKRLGVLGIFVKHRGIFHSLVIPLIVGLILFDQLGIIPAMAFVLGYLVHLILDAMTRSGIAFLYPFSKAKIKGPIKTGSLLDSLVFFMVIICDILMIFRL